MANVVEISTSDYPTKAKRPPNSRLSSRKFNKVFDWEMPHWKTSLPEIVEQIVQER